MRTREIEDFIRDECRDDWDEPVEEPEAVGECDLCGNELHDYDNGCLALVSADGTEAHVYCQYCADQMRDVVYVIEAAGLWFAQGYADEVIDSANEEVHRRSTLEQRMKRSRRFFKHPVTVERHGQRAF